MASLFSCWLCWLCLFLPTSHNTKAKKVNDEIKTDSKHGGGEQAKFGCPQRGRVILDSTNMNKGREGVKNPEKLADVLYGWPPRQK